MKSWQQDALILGLSATAGALDCWSYFGLKHVFVANMTGNTVLFGYSAATADVHRASASLLALLAYGAGVFAGSWMAKPVRAALRRVTDSGKRVWPLRMTRILELELLLILLAAVFDGLREATAEGHTSALLVTVVAFSVGLQSAAMQAMKLPGIVTTYITGTWTTMVSGLARLMDGEKISPGQVSWEKRLLLQASVLAAYCGGAGLIGLITHNTLARVPMGLVGTGILSAVVVGAAIWGADERD